MNLVWREFERRVRRLHRAELAKAPGLRKEFRAQRRKQPVWLGQIARRAALPVFWAWIFYQLVSKQHSFDLALSVITLWATGAALGWGHHWYLQFYGSDDLLVLNHLPLNDRQIFRYQLGRYAASAGWVLWEMFLGYAALAALIVEGPPLVAFPAAALLQSLLVLALALHAASRLHMLPLGTLGGLFRASAILLLMLGVQNLEFTQVFIQGTQWFLPSGWINYMLAGAHADPAILALLLPILGIIYLARFSFERLRAYYSLEGIEILPSTSSAHAHDAELTDESFRKPGPTEIEEHIASRSFLMGVHWDSAGPVERWAERIFTGEEQVIAEFLVASDPGWTRSLHWSFWTWLFVCLTTLAFGQFGGVVVFFAAYILAAASLPLFGGDWRGIRQIASGTVFLPGFALYPIPFNMIAKILLKVNILRICLASPLIVSFAALAAFKLKTGAGEGAMVAVKLLAILLSVQPFFVLFPISRTTNDSSRLSLLWLFVFAPLFVVLLAASFGVFLGRSAWEVLGSYAVLILISAVMFLLYRRAYRVGKFDLVAERSAR